MSVCPHADAWRFRVVQAGSLRPIGNRPSHVNFPTAKPVYTCGWKELFHPK